MTKSEKDILPQSVAPTKYDITLTPNFDNLTFKGEQTIDIHMSKPTSCITLHCTDISIGLVEITAPGGDSFKPAKTVFDQEEETVSFCFDSPMLVGNGKLRMQFSGELNDKLRGFYRSNYLDPEGNNQLLATTQFESTDARRAFPCWDEPSLKATFKLSLVIPKNLVAVSNMPVLSESILSGNQKIVHFNETPIMSTYLIAFIVGDMTCIKEIATCGTLVRVWTTRGKEEQGRFALDTSIKLLDYFNTYFGIPYPLPKLDHLAIPDFAAGAMENWGAITYREVALLVDPENSSAATRQRVAAIISHEMAHMWFGDLVTMKWWNDLWLNESFASWMGDKAVDVLFPDWDMWTQFLCTDTSSALSLDGLQNSHPIEQEVSNAAEIGQLFDAISYSKGASILRMLENFIGADNFRKGLHHYLSEHAYGNAETRDLWLSLAQVSNQPVEEMMNSWVQQMGYPVLEASVDRNSKPLAITLEQKRFLYEDILHKMPYAASDQPTWYVPVSIRTRNGITDSILLSERQVNLPIEPTGNIREEDWMKVNPEQTGFYRTKYSTTETTRLKIPVNDRTLPPRDRLGLQNDSYALCRAGHIPATQFLSLADAYRNETNAAVCQDLASNMRSMDSLLTEEQFYPHFRTFVRGIFQPIGERVGWDAQAGEGDLDSLLRTTVLLNLGHYGDHASLAEASIRFSQYVTNPRAVKPDLRSIVFSLAAFQGGRTTYDTMWELEKRSDLQEEKNRLQGALSSFSDPKLLLETLERSLSEEIRTQDTIRIVMFAASARGGRDLTWQFVKDHWPEFDRRYGEGGFALMRLVSITSGYASESKHEEVEKFFTDHPAPAAERTIRQSLEKIRLNAAWLQRNRQDLGAWFS